MVFLLSCELDKADWWASNEVVVSIFDWWSRASKESLTFLGSLEIGGILVAPSSMSDIPLRADANLLQDPKT